MGEGEDPLLLLKPKQIVIATTTLHPLLIKQLDKNAKLWIQGADLAPGTDITADQDIILALGQRIPVSTGIALVAPPGTYARIAPRSSLAVKHRIDIGAGVIDEDYQGEIKVVALINNSSIPFQIRLGNSIAQLILEKILNPRSSPGSVTNKYLTASYPLAIEWSNVLPVMVLTSVAQTLSRHSRNEAY
jgi:dUTP pyrophosphatase